MPNVGAVSAAVRARRMPGTCLLTGPQCPDGAAPARSRSRPRRRHRPLCPGTRHYPNGNRWRCGSGDQRRAGCVENGTMDADSELIRDCRGVGRRLWCRQASDPCGHRPRPRRPIQMRSCAVLFDLRMVLWKRVRRLETVSDARTSQRLALNGDGDHHHRDGRSFERPTESSLEFCSFLFL